MPPNNNNNNRDLLKYAGLTTQLFVALALAVFFGLKLDGWLHISSVLVWVIPLLVIVAVIYKLIKETNSKK